MGTVTFAMSFYLDGLVAGPNRSIEPPMSVGGMRFHQWFFGALTGAVLLGRRTFDVGPDIC